MKTSFVLLCLFLATYSIAQTPVPPPPKPPDSRPSLEVTMKFIQEKISDQGSRMNYAATCHDSASGWNGVLQISLDWTKVSADTAACRISYHMSVTVDGKVLFDGDAALDFRDVQDIIVLPYEQHAQRSQADQGHPAMSCTSTPALFAIKTRLPKKRYSEWPEFDFYEEELANRVAKAMVHAVELCGGGKPEPF